MADSEAVLESILRFPALRIAPRRKLSASSSTKRASNGRWPPAASPRWDTRIPSPHISGAPTPTCRAAESRALVEQLRKADEDAAHRDMVVYISMAFGNPYEEPWGPEIVEETLHLA